ncbi:LAT2 domain-containing protein isoform X1 [Micropterus salmoides]|uniref:LAT2 domain-containing protein isoform X1 n=1 Tax=Micropterus salmoides TaxID=27706 RepID=UPI0018EA4C24|nr:LAT2 domain-containing protein isoform X1 [Micropterus salmoides]XP_038564001.1 LAT2 domain-containing protein isoform X1 [Micropterus salmoides]
MIGNSSLLVAVLPVVSVVSLSLLSLLCLRCKKKTKIIHEEHQIYNPQTFQRGGSIFAVTQSKTVTRANQITSTSDETRDRFGETAISTSEPEYTNVHVAKGDPEHTYVSPLAVTEYINEKKDSDDDPGVYANVTSSPTKDDEDDYENSEFLDQRVEEQEDDEPDYVNEI